MQVKENIFSDHSKIKLEINNRTISENSQNILQLNDTLLNSPLVKEEIKSKLECILN